MKRLAFNLIWAVILSAVAVSCSVKEDRSGAPCYLTVHLDDADPDSLYRHTVITTHHGGRRVSSDTLVIADFIPEGFGISIPRGWNPLSAITGNVNSVIRHDSLYVARGRNFDRIFAHCALLDCNWDTEQDYVAFSKQHVVITIKAKTAFGGYYPADMRIRANSSGMNIFNFEPLIGPFTAFAERKRDGTLVFVVPRQGDNSMALDIMRPDGTIEVSFQLGRMIESSGYDWTKKDLDDITVTIDYASMNLSVSIENWDNENKGVIII